MYLGQKYIQAVTVTRVLRINANSTHRLVYPMCRIVCYQQSFFPSTIKLWNALPNDIAQCNSISLFKITVRQHLCLSNKLTVAKDFASFSSGKLGRILTQIRLGLSPLNYQLFEYNINDNPFCPKCGTEFETVIHYFCVCPHYDVDRILLKDSVDLLLTFLPRFLVVSIDVHKNVDFCKLLTNGVKLDMLSEQINNVVAQQVSEFDCQLYN